MEPLPRFFPLDRLIAFSDGVFAVVITLLVLGIDVPTNAVLDAAGIAAEREKLAHQLLIYGVCFSVIALYWTQHSLLYARLKRMERGLAVLNLLFLLPVTLLPFVTQLMGTMRNDWRSVLVFAIANSFAVLMVQWQWGHVAARPETHKDPHTPMLARRIKWGSRFFSAVLIGGVVVSMIDVKAGTAIILIMPFVYFFNFSRDLLGSRSHPPTDAGT